MIKILLQEVVKTLKSGEIYELAADYTNDPYYGKTDSSNEKYVIRSQAKKSTNSFYSYKMKQILKGKKARCEQYVMKKAKKRIRLNIVADVKYLKGKRDKKGCENLGFVVFGVNWTPRKVSIVYRRRFAIESSYQMRNIVKPKTSTKNTNLQAVSKLKPFLQLDNEQRWL